MTSDALVSDTGNCPLDKATTVHTLQTYFGGEFVRPFVGRFPVLFDHLGGIALIRPPTMAVISWGAAEVEPLRSVATII